MDDEAAHAERLVEALVQVRDVEAKHAGKEDLEKLPAQLAFYEGRIARTEERVLQMQEVLAEIGRIPFPKGEKDGEKKRKT